MVLSCGFSWINEGKIQWQNNVDKTMQICFWSVLRQTELFFGRLFLVAFCLRVFQLLNSVFACYQELHRPRFVSSNLSFWFRWITQTSVRISIGYFEATRGYVIYSPRRAAPRWINTYPRGTHIPEHVSPILFPLPKLKFSVICKLTIDSHIFGRGDSKSLYSFGVEFASHSQPCNGVTFSFLVQ